MSQARAGLMLVIGILGTAFMLRAPITSAPPALPSIRADLDLSEALAGATTSLPLVCLGVFAFLTPLLVARWGLERTMFAALVPLLFGLVVRSTGSVAAFFVGAVFVGVGIAIGNVLVPALIRTRFPLRMALLMGLYTGILQVSAAVGSALTAPLELGLGLGWELAIGVWAVPAALVLAWWVMLVLRHGARSEVTDPPTGMAVVVRRRMTWLVTVFIGVQSLVFYSLVTWLPEQLIGQGHSVAAAGALLGMFSLLGLPGAFLGPRYATGRRAGWFIGTVYSVQVVGILLLGAGLVPSAIGAVLCGFTQGAAFSSALTFIADQPNSRDVAAVSAFAQGVGYTLAASGPIALGAIYGATGTWWAPNVLLIVFTVTLLTLGAYTGTRLYAAHVALGRR